MPWFVIYTKPRSEKKVADQLQKCGIEAYCPMVTQMRQYSDRKKKVTVPLINSYVFINIEEKKRDNVFEVGGVVRYLFWLGKPAIVRNEEIEALKSWLDHTAITVRMESIVPGTKMVVPSGPFKGKEGLVHMVKKNEIQLILTELGIKLFLTRME